MFFQYDGVLARSSLESRIGRNCPFLGHQNASPNPFNFLAFVIVERHSVHRKLNTTHEIIDRTVNSWGYISIGASH